MSENKKEKGSQPSVFARIGGKIKNIFETYKAEFRKIVWPTRQVLIKHTATVIVVSLIFGIYIAINDGIFGWLFNQFVVLIR